jgi:DNA-binding GntR family transcriptional regulator
MDETARSSAEGEPEGAGRPSFRGRSEWAYQQLLEGIQSGEIPPGQRMTEVELSAALEISRTPIREALQRLLADGLVEHAPGRGLAVARYDLRAIAEFYAVRGPLEGTAAGLAAENADVTEIGMLRALLDAMRAGPQDAQFQARENQRFHELIYRAAHNRFLLKSMQVLLNSVALIGRTTFHMPGRIETALREHEEIVDAIAARDPAAAEAAARRHIQNSYNARVAAMSGDVEASAQKRAGRPFPARTP